MENLAFDAVLCDLDGVIRLYDLAEVRRLERIAGLPQGTTAEIAFAPERDLPLLLGQISRAQWTASIAKALTRRIPAPQAETLATAFTHAPFRADGAVVELIRRLRGKVPVVLVTNATVWLDEDLALLGLTDLADHVVNSSRVGIAKPDPGIYQLAVEQAGVPAERCLFVDNNQANIDAARAAGMTAVLYRHPSDLLRALAPILEQDAEVLPG
ncbi:HAD family phosphatase [Streptomyces sp. FH025]|uniref:HAD family hydrolase n=1 Tax=Streptomyces sp. FH025 TaxID=2815937 RepID=UPI001A9F27B2|nr:HAD family phosphatase [Streptomyces sp. FH025]MBO1414275.1 HAD family phosphatase [Streptomyces sp. FH025]